jgi:DNA mismatch repair ATPase MutL
VFLSIKLPPDGVDVNLEPNKTRVLLTEKDRILDSIKGMLEKFYKKEIQKDKECLVLSSEDKETCKIVEHSTDKNSKEIDVIEKRRCASDGQLPSPNFNIFINSSSASEHLIDDLKMDDTISPIDSSTLNNVFSIKNGIEESNNLPAKEVSDTNSQEPSEQTPCLFTAMVSGVSVADQHRDSVECATVNNRELVAITPTSLSAAVIPCNQQIDTTEGTTDDIVKESLTAMSNSLTLPTISASATRECDKLEDSTDCLVKNTAHNHLTDKTEASNLHVTKETTFTGINESSQDSNTCLDKEDVNNIYRLLDLSEKENHIAFFGEQDTLGFPKPPNEQTVIQQDKDISKTNNGSFDFDNVFNDDLEFDQILQDIAKNKARSQSSQSTQSSEPNTQTAASKLKDLIDSNDKDIWDKDISGKDWSMGNILKDKQENFLEVGTCGVEASLAVECLLINHSLPIDRSSMVDCIRSIRAQLLEWHTLCCYL